MFRKKYDLSLYAALRMEARDTNWLRNIANNSLTHSSSEARRACLQRALSLRHANKISGMFHATFDVGILYVLSSR